MGKSGGIVVGLDIGTTMISCLVGEQTEHGFEVIGVGTARSSGLRRGMVLNIDATVQSIRQAVADAELMAGCEINEVYCAITGSHVRSLNSQGMVAIKEKQVADADVNRVLDTAQAVAIPMDREVIHVIPQEYLVDDQDGIREPRGMSGVRLAAKVHIVTVAVASAQNIVKCCNLAGLSVREIILAPLASAEATLTPDERELGVMLVDCGGGTMDIALFSRGSVVHSSVMPLGGDHITNDIAYGLRTPTSRAEEIKQKHGVAVTALVEDDQEIEVDTVGGNRTQTASRLMLAEIIEPRVAEMFELVLDDLKNSKFQDLLPAGVVLTGGTSQLRGIAEVAERVFGMPVRIGAPRDIAGLSGVINSPTFSTAVGLLHFAAEAERTFEPEKPPEERLMDRFRSQVARWFGNFL